MKALLELPTAKTSEASSRRRKRREAGKRRRRRTRAAVAESVCRPPVSPAVSRARPCDRRPGLGCRLRRPRRPLAHALPDHHDTEHARHDRQGEDPAQRDAEVEQEQRRQRPDDGAGRVHRAVQAEREAAVLVADVRPRAARRAAPCACLCRRGREHARRARPARRRPAPARACRARPGRSRPARTGAAARSRRRAGRRGSG